MVATKINDGLIIVSPSFIEENNMRLDVTSHSKKENKNSNNKHGNDQINPPIALFCSCSFWLLRQQLFHVFVSAFLFAHPYGMRFFAANHALYRYHRQW